MSQNNTKLKQESFFIQEEQIVNRKKILRQDRWQAEVGRCFLFIPAVNLNLEVTNISAFGCAVQLPTTAIEKVKQHLGVDQAIKVTLVYSDIETQTLSLKLVRTWEIDHTSSFVAFETLHEPINVERCKAISEANQIIDFQIQQATQLNKIPVGFRTIVHDLKYWFTNLRQQIEEIEKKSPVDNAQSDEEFRLTIAEVVSDYLGKFLPEVYQTIPALFRDLTKEEQQICTKFVREQLAPFVYGAPFANRAYYKPRGYAGDYEMMNHLYRSEMVGRTLFDQCMHKYFIEEPAANAVKNRGHYLHDKIKQTVERKSPNETIKILSIASGPALEQQLFVMQNPQFYNRKIEFTCIDQDEESLKHAQRQLVALNRQKNAGFTFNFNNLAIRNIIAQGVPEKDFDLIYSAGLFDYFTDPVAQVAAKQMHEALNNNGNLIIGNYSKNNPTAPLMEVFLDWILIYRSSEDMKNLFNETGSHVTVEAEPLQINLFAVIKK